jgi:hypothetical protein
VALLLKDPDGQVERSLTQTRIVDRGPIGEYLMLPLCRPERNTAFGEALLSMKLPTST